MVEGGILATVAGLAKFGSEIVSAKDETERNKLLIEFQKSVIAANLQLAMLQQENSTLKGAIEDLKREAVRKENWESESKRYALHEAAQGLVVYGLKCKNRGVRSFNIIFLEIKL